MSGECDDCNEHCLDCECEEKESSLDEIIEKLDALQNDVDKIMGLVNEDTFEKKIKTLNDLNEKVTDNMNRLNEMLKKLKGVVAVAIGNLA